MTEIIFATGNKDKMREIREIMADCDVHIVSMKEAGIRVDIVEDGTTFEENAKIKARAVAAHTDAIVLADDSGLEIDALNKEPGVYSARYMGEDTSYDVKNKNLIDRLDGVPKEKRTARFVCAIAAVEVTHHHPIFVGSIRASTNGVLTNILYFHATVFITSVFSFTCFLVFSAKSPLLWPCV